MRRVIIAFMIFFGVLGLAQLFYPGSQDAFLWFNIAILYISFLILSLKIIDLIEENKVLRTMANNRIWPDLVTTMSQRHENVHTDLPGKKRSQARKE